MEIGDHSGRSTTGNTPRARPSKGEYRRNLPHLQVSGRTHFVTFRTFAGFVLPEATRDHVLRHCLHDHGAKLVMHACVVMPDHVHAVFSPMADCEGRDYGLAEILGGTKGASAHGVNQLLKRHGRLWQDESFDHVLRREERIENTVEYVRQNPVRAGLVATPEEYPWLWTEG